MLHTVLPHVALVGQEKLQGPPGRAAGRAPVLGLLLSALPAPLPQQAAGFCRGLQKLHILQQKGSPREHALKGRVSPGQEKAVGQGPACCGELIYNPGMSFIGLAISSYLPPSVN